MCFCRRKDLCAGPSEATAALSKPCRQLFMETYSPITEGIHRPSQGWAAWVAFSVFDYVWHEEICFKSLSLRA